MNNRSNFLQFTRVIQLGFDFDQSSLGVCQSIACVDAWQLVSSLPNNSTKGQVEPRVCTRMKHD